MSILLSEAWMREWSLTQRQTWAPYSIMLIIEFILPPPNYRSLLSGTESDQALWLCGWAEKGHPEKRLPKKSSSPVFTGATRSLRAHVGHWQWRLQAPCDTVNRKESTLVCNCGERYWRQHQNGLSSGSHVGGSTATLEVRFVTVTGERARDVE